MAAPAMREGGPDLLCAQLRHRYPGNEDVARIVQAYHAACAKSSSDSLRSDLYAIMEEMISPRHGLLPLDEHYPNSGFATFDASTPFELPPGVRSNDGRHYFFTGKYRELCDVLTHPALERFEQIASVRRRQRTSGL